jgi:hypothetical protein
MQCTWYLVTCNEHSLELTIGKRGRNRGFQLFYGTTQSEPSWQAHTSAFSPEARLGTTAEQVPHGVTNPMMCV